MTADAMFRLHHNHFLKGDLRWSDATGKGTMKGRESPLSLKGSHSIQWLDYSKLEGPGPGIFRYALFKIEPVFTDATPSAQLCGP
jgi:hypothetical protein